MKKETKVKSITVIIEGREIVMSLDTAKKLKTELDEILREPVINFPIQPICPKPDYPTRPWVTYDETTFNVRR